MPQDTQSAGLTSACAGNGNLSVRGTSLIASYGQSSTQREQPLQWSRSLTAALALRNGGSHGISAIISENAPRNAQTAPLPHNSVSG